jgi:hypothetical protein
MSCGSPIHRPGNNEYVVTPSDDEAGKTAIILVLWIERLNLLNLTIAAKVLLSISIFLAIHAVLSAVFLIDLYSVSQRQNKFQWGLIIAFVPLISAILYHRSKKRSRLHNGPITGTS